MNTEVRLKKALFKQLTQFNELTGVSIAKCVDEAVANWIECVAPDRIEAALSQSEIRHARN